MTASVRKTPSAAPDVVIPELGDGNWSAICEQLITAFPQVPVGEVILEVARARSGVSLFGLEEPEQLTAVEAMARHGLMLATGQLEDVARLDPQRHGRRRSTAN